MAALRPSAMDQAKVSRGSLDGIVPLDKMRYSLPPEIVDKYLHRLGVNRAAAWITPDLKTLTLLQNAHADFIAYENLGMHQAEPPSLPPLDPLASATRICEGRRGGYCFLLVDAYAALLTTLGFTVSLHVGGVGEDPLPENKWGNHVVLLVHGLPEADYFVSDVGLGDGPPDPFPLRSVQFSISFPGSFSRPLITDVGKWRDRLGYSYTLEERGIDEYWFTHDPTGSFVGFGIRVGTSCAGAHEFQSYHEYLWTHGESGFRTAGTVLQRVSPGRHRPDEDCTSSPADLGALTMRNATLKRCHPSLVGGEEVLATAKDMSEWLEMVRTTFFLPLDETLTEEEKAQLWSVIRAKQSEWEEKRKRERAALLLPWKIAGVAALVWWYTTQNGLTSVVWLERWMGRQLGRCLTHLGRLFGLTHLYNGLDITQQWIGRLFGRVLMALRQWTIQWGRGLAHFYAVVVVKPVSSIGRLCLSGLTHLYKTMISGMGRLWTGLWGRGLTRLHSSTGIDLGVTHPPRSQVLKGRA